MDEQQAREIRAAFEEAVLRRCAELMDISVEEARRLDDELQWEPEQTRFGGAMRPEDA